jgi:hypothetical protein
MRQSRAEWEGGTVRWWELLRAIWPRSRIASPGTAVLVLSLSVVPLQLAPSCRYQDLPEPVAQVTGALALKGVLCRLPDEGVMLGKQSDPHGRAVSARFLDRWSSHTSILGTNGTTSQVENLRQTP